MKLRVRFKLTRIYIDIFNVGIFLAVFLVGWRMSASSPTGTCIKYLDTCMYIGLINGLSVAAPSRNLPFTTSWRIVHEPPVAQGCSKGSLSYPESNASQLQPGNINYRIAIKSRDAYIQINMQKSEAGLRI